MENKSGFGQWLSTLNEKLSEQQWFQELKTKWDELDAQSRFYAKIAAAGAAALTLILLILTSVMSVYATKSEFGKKMELLSTIQTATEELRRLKETTSSASGAASEAGPWTPYLETTAATAGVDKSALSISPESAGASTETIKETLLDITMKHVNIRQIVTYAFRLENGPRPVKLRNLTIDTKSDPTGYMDATLSVSGFSLLNK